jgi:hypothetical protein
MAIKRQGYKARQDESLGARRGARKSLKNKVSKAGRRAMGSGPRAAAGGKKFGLTPRKGSVRGAARSGARRPARDLR